MEIKNIINHQYNFTYLAQKLQIEDVSNVQHLHTYTTPTQVVRLNHFDFHKLSHGLYLCSTNTYDRRCVRYPSGVNV